MGQNKLSQEYILYIGLPLPDDQCILQKTDEKGRELGVENYFLNLSVTSNFCS